MKALTFVPLLLVGCTNALESDAPDVMPVEDEQWTSSDQGASGPGGNGPGAGACAAPVGDGRAFGIRAEVLGGLVEVSPFPDTATGGHSLLDVAAGLCTPCAKLALFDTVFSVTHESTGTGTALVETATATTNNLRLAIPGLDLRAATLVATATASAEGQDTEVSASGSIVQGLTINGTRFLDIDALIRIAVTDPITHTPIAEVHVLEQVEDADGEVHSIYVNAIRVHVFDLALTPLIDEETEIVIGHAEASVGAALCPIPQ